MDYDSRAKAYAATRGLDLDAISAWRDAIAPYLDSAQGRPIVDVGSGAGHFAVALATWFGLPVLGIEPSSGMRAVARRERSHRLVSYVGGRAEALPVANRACSGAWLSTVIHHLADLGACARELRRVLGAEAPVLIRGAFDGHLNGITLLRFFPEARRVAERFPSVSAVEAAFAPTGMRLVQVEDVPQVSTPSLRAFCDGLRTLRHADSTLVSLSDEEFAAGLERAERAAVEETAPAPVVDKLTLVVLR